MAVVIIPTRGDIANYSQLVELDGVVFRFTFRFNDRDDSWYVSIADADGVPIREGLKLVPNYALLRTLARNESRPGGDFIMVDARAVPLPPSLEELGTTVLFTYVGFDP